MVYIGTTAVDGRAVYFDVHATERSKAGLRVCGMIGDGQYEGEVLIEIGTDTEVTFADAWLGADGFREFIGRCDLPTLCDDLLASLEDCLPSIGRNRNYPVRPKGRCRGTCANESGPFWSVVS